MVGGWASRLGLWICGLVLVCDGWSQADDYDLAGGADIDSWVAGSVWVLCQEDGGMSLLSFWGGWRLSHVAATIFWYDEFFLIIEK